MFKFKSNTSSITTLDLIVTKFLLITLLLLAWFTFGVLAAAKTKSSSGKGQWELLLNSSGVVAMHMALTHYNTVIMFDQTSAGPSGYRESCSSASADGDPSCWAHSMEYDIQSNTIRPLRIVTDTWCSSGGFLSSGILAQTGGHGDGSRRIRYFNPCPNRRCNWRELDSYLAEPRWYATNQVLPDGERMIVVGGIDAYSYEFVPKQSKNEGSYQLPFLRQTLNRRPEYDNLYPFLHLSSDGNLFIFANQDSVLLDYRANRVLRTFPRMPGDGPRNYPGTGSSVMLPLDHADGFRKVEIMVCGGGAPGAYRAARNGEFRQALSSCGRMVITDDSPQWTMEEMPEPRVMGDMLILPSGEILIINGATHGSAGWERASNPSYRPVLYNPQGSVGNRFSVLRGSNIARLYHSSAIVLPDGRVLVAGSNPHQTYEFRHVTYPTELRIEAFYPHYLNQNFNNQRATNVYIRTANGGNTVGYGEQFEVIFQIDAWRIESNAVEFYAYAPSFTTHSFSMNQRMLKLQCYQLGGGDERSWTATLVAPLPQPLHRQAITCLPSSTKGSLVSQHG